MPDIAAAAAALDRAMPLAQGGPPELMTALQEAMAALTAPDGAATGGPPPGPPAGPPGAGPPPGMNALLRGG